MFLSEILKIHICWSKVNLEFHHFAFKYVLFLRFWKPLWSWRLDQFQNFSKAWKVLNEMLRLHESLRYELKIPEGNEFYSWPVYSCKLFLQLVSNFFYSCELFLQLILADVLSSRSPNLSTFLNSLYANNTI